MPIDRSNPEDNTSNLEADSVGAETASQFNPFEAALITAGREDSLPSARRELLLHNISIGIGGPVGESSDTAPDVETPHAPGGTTHLVGQGALAKAVGVLALTGVAVWAGWRATVVETPSATDKPSTARSTPDELYPAAPQELPHSIETVAVEAPRVEESRDSVSGAVVEEANAGKPERKVRPASDTLSRELALIDSARSALLRGDPSSALRALASYRRQFPRGALQAEATVQRVEALIASGDKRSASTIGESFLKRHPDSPYARRIASLLGVSRESTEGPRRGK